MAGIPPGCHALVTGGVVAKAPQPPAIGWQASGLPCAGCPNYSERLRSLTVHVGGKKLLPSAFNQHMISLRPATPFDIALLQAWDEQPHVVPADPNDDWGWKIELSRHPIWREQLIAEMSGRPIGFVQIIDPEQEDSHYWGSIEANLRAMDIWLGDEADLGKGFGTQIMHLALARCFASPDVTAVLVDPLSNNERSHQFYQRLGFTPLGTRWFGQDECLVHQITSHKSRVCRPTIKGWTNSRAKPLRFIFSRCWTELRSGSVDAATGGRP